MSGVMPWEEENECEECGLKNTSLIDGLCIHCTGEKEMIEEDFG